MPFEVDSHLVSKFNQATFSNLITAPMKLSYEPIRDRHEGHLQSLHGQPFRTNRKDSIW